MTVEKIVTVCNNRSIAAAVFSALHFYTPYKTVTLMQ
jgi:hypothetical protein